MISSCPSRCPIKLDIYAPTNVPGHGRSLQANRPCRQIRCTQVLQATDKLGGQQSVIVFSPQSYLVFRSEAFFLTASSPSLSTIFLRSLGVSSAHLPRSSSFEAFLLVAASMPFSKRGVEVKMRWPTGCPS